MSETKHTEGPWHPGHFGSEGSCQCKSVVSEGYAGSICTISVNNGLPIGEGGNDAPTRDEAIANMHLIAAAPELLEAAKKMSAAYEAWVRGDGTAYDAPILDLRVAISKATGDGS